MTKKDFNNKINTNPVYSTIAEATEQLPGQLELTEDGEIVENESNMPFFRADGTIGPVETKERKERRTYTAEETLEALENMKSSGRKGVKMPRINLAFTPANYEFIKTMAQVRGQNLTEFVNDMLAEARNSHQDVYEKAMEFRKSL